MAPRGLPERLRYLRSREALAAVLLPAVIAWAWWNKGGDIAWGLRCAALVVFAAILLQGTLYWHLKLGQVVHDRPLPSWFRPLFCAFKWSNLAAIGALLAGLVPLDRQAVTAADFKWTAGLLAGAVLEQVNYYHYQLMYDTREAFRYLRRNRRLRKAALGIDMMRSRARTARTA